MKLLNKEILKKYIDVMAEYDLENNKIFGSAYLVYQRDNLVYQKCYGTVDLNSKEEVTDTTMFRLASMTKPISTVAALILVDRGIISLDDPIDKFLPDFKDILIVDEKGNKIKPTKIPTIKNLLNHTSGIGCNPSKETTLTQEEFKDLDGAKSFYLRVGLDFEPESMQQYSPTGAFDILAKIIEIVSGMDYLSFLEKEIFIPCQMKDTTFKPTKEQKNRIIKMHNKENDQNAVFDMYDGCIFECYPYDHFLGGAGLASTLKDYANFAQMLLNKGEFNGNRLLSESTFNQMCVPQVSYELMPQTERWGLGVRVITDESYPNLPVGSFGWSGAYGSHFWIDPVNQIYAVYMKNSKFDGGAANESARYFERAVYLSVEDAE